MAALPVPGPGGGYESPRSGRRLSAITQILRRLSRPEEIDEAAHSVAAEAVQVAHALAGRASEDPQHAMQELARAARIARVTARHRDEALREALGHASRGAAVPNTDQRIAGAVTAWRSFLAEFHAEPVWPGVVVFNEAHEYAGPIDGFLRTEGSLVLVHYHQLVSDLSVIPFAAAAVARAEYAVTDAGAEILIPAAAGALAVQLHPSGAFEARPVQATEDHWRAFLGLRIAHALSGRKDAINGPVGPEGLARALQRPVGQPATARLGPEL